MNDETQPSYRPQDAESDATLPADLTKPARVETSTHAAGSGGDAPLFSFSRLPDQTDTWQQDRIQDQQAFWQRG